MVQLFHFCKMRGLQGREEGVAHFLDMSLIAHCSYQPGQGVAVLVQQEEVEQKQSL